MIRIQIEALGREVATLKSRRLPVGKIQAAWEADDVSTGLAVIHLS